MEVGGLNQAGGVDTELQESISMLVSALGGPDPETRNYKLGDEALACLRDLRKWLQFYDAKYDRLEVACAIANTTLVMSDIPQILGDWETKMRKTSDPYYDRIALACLELLVPLTWPIEFAGKEATSEHFMQATFLKSAQKRYKTAIIAHDSHAILRAAIQIAKPVLATSLRDRDTRDEGILTLACLFLRNILAIDTGEDDDRSVTVAEYQKQKVLSLFITLGSSMGERFDIQDILLVESLYHLLRGTDVKKMFGLVESDEPMEDVFKQNLKVLMDVEDDMKKAHFKSSRHSRFGTMVSMDEGKGESVFISGQRGVAGVGSSMSRLDMYKKWNKPRQRGVLDEHEMASYMPSVLPINGDQDTLNTLKSFACAFLDSSFNPLFIKIGKQVERQNARITRANIVHFSYLIAWFLDAEAARAKAEHKQIDFLLLGGVLTESSFNNALKLLRRSLEPGEHKNTDLAHACMVRFRHMIMTIHAMSYCENEELRDVAEGMKAWLFYQEEWLSLLSTLPRTSKGKSLAYACETVAVTHVVLKTLEAYSKQYTVMFVKMKRARKRRTLKGTVSAEGYDGNDDYDGSAQQDHEESTRETNQRKFSFEKFVLKYINEQTIVTYERVLSNYREGTEDTMLQVFSFFRKTFGKTSCRSQFYRMQMVQLLLEVTAHRGLPQGSKSRDAAEHFLRYYVQKFVSTASALPSLHVQMNVQMTPGDAFYYDHAGVDKLKWKPPRYEFTLTDKALREFSPELQFAVIVADLIDKGKDAFLKWLEETLMSLIQSGDHDNYQLSSSSNQPTLVRRQLTADQGKIKIVHNDATIRLLLRSMGLNVNTAHGQISVPTTIDEIAFIEKIQWLAKYQNETIEFPAGKAAMGYIKKVDEPDRADDESDGENHETDPSILAPSTRRMMPNGLQRNSATGPFVTTFECQEEDRESLGTSLEATVENDMSVPTSPELNKRPFSAAFTIVPSDDDEDQMSQMASMERVKKRKGVTDDDDDE